MRNPFRSGSAESFFWKRAGYSHGANESAAQGRKRCALSMAEDERNARSAGLTFDWSQDDQTDESFRETTAPYYLWVCTCRDESGAVLASCGGIDLGPDPSAPYPYGCGPLGNPTHKGGRDPYCRVMEAELAGEALAELTKS